MYAYSINICNYISIYNKPCVYNRVPCIIKDRRLFWLSVLSYFEKQPNNVLYFKKTSFKMLKCPIHFLFFSLERVKITFR